VEDHVLDRVRVDAELPHRPDQGAPCMIKAGVHQVVALAANQERVREGDHAGGPPALLQGPVSLEALGGAVDARRLGLTVGDREDVALGGHEDVDAGHRRGE